MTKQLKFDAERYCRHNAGRMGKWMDGGDVATMIADEVKALREEVAALKEAARPVVKFAHALREVHKPYDQRSCTMSGVMAYVTSDQLDALAALVGEE